MKKKKLKRKYKIIIIIIILVILCLVIFNRKDNSKDIVIDNTDIEEEVYKKINDKDIDESFISWVNENYKGSLNKLDKLLNKNNYNKTMWHDITGNSYLVLRDLYDKKYNNMDNVKIMKSNSPSTLSFVGDVSLADNWFIAPKYDERGGIDGILSKDMLKIMRDSDLMVVNSEFTVSNRGTPLKNKQYTFRAKPERLPIYNEMGVDLVALANNHVYDYGRDAFLDMLDAFDKYKIPRVGAGRNLEEASKPYYFIINGYKIGILNATRAEKYIMTPGATKDDLGVFRCYDPTNMINQIKKIRNESDYVISIIHFGRENSHELEKEQVSSARKYIDAGSDMVVGHHAHTLQGVEIYKDKPIIYNLGNFLFNDLVVDTALFKVILDNSGTMEYYIVPALQKNEYTDIVTGKKKKQIIKDINSWSINAYLDENGKIIKK